MREGTLREWQTQLKSEKEWGPGPWNNEPDKRQWVDKKTGLACLMLRAGHMGHWCGYVGVPKGHPAYGKGYDDVDVQVHGGLTFSDMCRHPTKEMWERQRERYVKAETEAKIYPRGDAARFRREWADFIGSYDDWAAVYQTKAICHIPEPGSPDDVFWLGFDCAHAGDLSPGIENAYRYLGSRPSFAEGNVYRDVQYVQDEVTNLASQLGRMI